MPRSSENVIKFQAPGGRSNRKGIEQQVGEKEIRQLFQLVEYYGLGPLAKDIGVSKITLLMVLAGFIHRCQPRTVQAVREFFATTPL